MFFSKKREIEISKRSREIKNEALANIKLDRCLICEKDSSSFCNSHSIPRFILANIAEDGIVYTPEEAKNGGKIIHKNVYESIVGINKAKVFRNICNECDNDIFNLVEDKTVLEKEFTDKEYTLYTLKILLHDIYIKFFTSELFTLGKRQQGIARAIKIPWLLDVQDMLKEKEEYVSAIKVGKNIRNNIILDTIINKKTKFACITKVTLNFSYTGKKLYNLTDYQMRFGHIYILVLPYDECHTKVCMYYRRKYKIYNEVKDEFNKFTLEEKLQAISNLIIMHTEDFVCNYEVIEKLKDIRTILQEEAVDLDYSEDYLKRINELNKKGINLFNF